MTWEEAVQKANQILTERINAGDKSMFDGAKNPDGTYDDSKMLDSVLAAKANIAAKLFQEADSNADDRMQKGQTE